MANLPAAGPASAPTISTANINTASIRRNALSIRKVCHAEKTKGAAGI